MHPSILFQFAALGMLSSTVSSIQVINAVWSTTGFSTISGPGGGSESSHGSGFALLDQDGNTIYSNSAPGDHVPCQGNEYTFTLSGGCFAPGQQYEFACSSKFDGSPKHCKALDSSSNTLAEADGNESTKFIGIAIGQDGYCGVSFALGENVHCAPDSKGFKIN